MGSNRAFFVLGPESSGTRLVTSILIAGGCQGSSDHIQPFDETGFVGNPAVLRRSVPHNGGWLNGPALLERAKAGGYTPAAVVVVRDWFCNELSQVTQGHTISSDQAGGNIGRAYYEIFTTLWNLRIPFTMAVYESLVLHPTKAQYALLDTLGLERPSSPVIITDEDAKHWDHLVPDLPQLELFAS